MTTKRVPEKKIIRVVEGPDGDSHIAVCDNDDPHTDAVEAIHALRDPDTGEFDGAVYGSAVTVRREQIPALVAALNEPAPRVGTRVEPLWIRHPRHPVPGIALFFGRTHVEICRAVYGLNEQPERAGVEWFGAPRIGIGELRFLADFVTGLYQCDGCKCWYRGGEVCPECGEERGQ